MQYIFVIFSFGEDNEHDTIIDTPQAGMQSWTVPRTVNWKIVCAKGGYSHDMGSGRSLEGGHGVVVGGLVKLFKNGIIKIACVQMGSSRNSWTCAGGGAGTFLVLYKSGENNPNYKTGEISNNPN